MNNIQFGSNQFCGPSVLSAICGITTDEAAAVIQSVTGQHRDVKGVFSSDLRKSFVSLGYKCQTVNIPSGFSVFKAMFALTGKDGIYIFMVPGHFIAIEVNGKNRFICDNHTKEPINLSNSSRLSQKVSSIFKVEKL